jgi:8-oxo-dGTP diphosphatase
LPRNARFQSLPLAEYSSGFAEKANSTGGKIKPGETPEHCLRREIAEEMAIEIAVHHALPGVTNAYPTFTITLYPFVCSIISGTITLHEHAAVTWLPRENLASLDWADADLPVLASYCRFAGQGQVTS